ncbi:AAA family ATPase [Faecalicatena contorta]|uniref:AAA family ATPase n=1 Tax=Faecalicatena contorta TaxID=39482 RepID=UPI001F3BDA4D|nr:AAA family ATPase [Faecalicatena contorta]MCF2681959.1 AAA family ATPase [Faecalicatena contorta]
MKRPIVILADTDYEYLLSLELKFIEIYGNRIELIIITEETFFAEYFAVQREADVLVISELLYQDALKKHEIQRIVVLSENTRSTESIGNLIRVNKFSSVKNIMNEAVYSLHFTDDAKEKKTKVVTVCSAIGGAGKTTISIGLCKCLAEHHKKVLFISTESVQSFAFFLKDKIYLDANVYRLLRDDSRNHYADLRPYVRNEGFSFVPPLMASLDSLQISCDMFAKLMDEAAESGDYDYIIVDTDSGLRPEIAEYIGKSDFVGIIVMQDPLSVEKTKFLLQNMDCSNPEKYTFICNQYESNVDNMLSQEVLGEHPVSEYIEKFERHFTLDELGECEGIKGMMCMLL